MTRAVTPRWVLALLAAAAFSVLPRTSHAAGEPAPTPSAGLALSDKPPPGCCCFADPSSRAPAACSYGLHEDKCRIAGKNFANRVTTWSAGKCPRK